jgi:hypothetical protein
VEIDDRLPVGDSILTPGKLTPVWKAMYLIWRRI